MKIKEIKSALCLIKIICDGSVLIGSLLEYMKQPALGFAHKLYNAPEKKNWER